MELVQQTVLEQILARKREEVAQLPDPGAPLDLSPRRSLVRALADVATARAPDRPTPGLALIAEIKRRSPSRALIRSDFDPPVMARAYQRGGAAALSVLTDATDFGGSLAHLAQVREASSLPILRKDFIVDVRQLAEAKRAGADAVLLIAACLDDPELQSLLAAARNWDLEALVEVHDEADLDRVLAHGADLVGINNRNLDTFEVDLGTTLRLCRRLALVRPDRAPLIVSESGIKGPGDVVRLAEAGCTAILVGEGLLIQPDLEAAVRRLLAPPAEAS